MKNINILLWRALLITSDLYGICYWELSFIPNASLLIYTSLGQTHLLRHDLLGLWFSAQAQVHPHKNILHIKYYTL